MKFRIQLLDDSSPVTAYSVIEDMSLSSANILLAASCLESILRAFHRPVFEVEFKRERRQMDIVEFVTLSNEHMERALTYIIES